MPAEIAPQSRAAEDNDAAKLAALERRWNENFLKSPKLPTSALLTGALSMALGFGFVMFLAFHTMRRYAWIWAVLGLIAGAVNRLLAKRWYEKVVLPWDAERRALAQEMEVLKQKLGKAG